METASSNSKTRQLFLKLANTDHRRSLTAERIFRQLRQEEDARQRRAAEA